MSGFLNPSGGHRHLHRRPCLLFVMVARYFSPNAFYVLASVVGNGKF